MIEPEKSYDVFVKAALTTVYKEWLYAEGFDVPKYGDTVEWIPAKGFTPLAPVKT